VKCLWGGYSKTDDHGSEVKILQQDWLATEEGLCLPGLTEQQDDEASTKPYRLYRFLTDIEDIIEQEVDDRLRLQKICPLVRRLLNSCEWLQVNFIPPDPETGWSVQTLYDEPDFPITIQTVVWAPGTVSPIHNHATWGIVALLEGQEKNTFWQRSPTAKSPDRITTASDHLLTAGDILCFLPDAIHQIEAIGTEPTMSFNLYGETNYDQRFEFDVEQATAQIF
jgi:predicted metal-dependent enzyme (double-stranded beta helix superfamily)